MGNMSYCRFRNTLQDLRDCMDAMDEGDDKPLSKEENAARYRLVMVCQTIADNYIDDDTLLPTFPKE